VSDVEAIYAVAAGLTDASTRVAGEARLDVDDLADATGGAVVSLAFARGAADVAVGREATLETSPVAVACLPVGAAGSAGGCRDHDAGSESAVVGAADAGVAVGGGAVGGAGAF